MLTLSFSKQGFHTQLPKCSDSLLCLFLLSVLWVHVTEFRLIYPLSRGTSGGLMALKKHPKYTEDLQIQNYSEIHIGC